MDKQKQVKRMILIILCVVGAAFVIGGGCFYAYVGKIEKEFKPVVAKIENIEKHTQRRHGETEIRYDVTVSYQVDGVHYTSPINEYSSLMKIGQSIDLMYNPADPTEVRSTKIEKTIAVVLFAAGIFLLIVTWLVMPRILKRTGLR